MSRKSYFATRSFRINLANVQKNIRLSHAVIDIIKHKCNLKFFLALTCIKLGGSYEAVAFVAFMRSVCNITS